MIISMTKAEKSVTILIYKYNQSYFSNISWNCRIIYNEKIDYPIKQLKLKDLITELEKVVDTWSIDNTDVINVMPLVKQHSTIFKDLLDQGAIIIFSNVDGDEYMDLSESERTKYSFPLTLSNLLLNNPKPLVIEMIENNDS